MEKRRLPANRRKLPSETYCVTAEVGIRATTNGMYQLCCMSKDNLKGEDGKVFQVNKHSFNDVWNSAHRKKINDDLMNGIKHSNCTRCWSEEDAGFLSRRQRDNAKHVTGQGSDPGGYHIFTPDSPAKPMIAEFNLGNTCNLKCRTCGPWSSSKWHEEFYSTPELHKQDLATRENPKIISRRMQKFYIDDSIFWEGFKEMLPSLIHIDFYGGEPFMVKKQWAMLEYAIEQGYAKNIYIHYNINGTFWDIEKMQRIMTHFRGLKIDFSIDGLEDKFEYMRHLAKWDEVMPHILQASEQLGRDMSICHTISINNILYIDEMIKWVDLHGIDLYLNLVHGPEHYNIQNLPTKVKEIIKTKLEANISDERKGFIRLDGTINFMMEKEMDPDKLQEFFTVTDAVDKNRNESYAATFPEMHELLKEYRK